MRLLSAILILFLASRCICAQTQAIFLDGKGDEWDINSPTFTDTRSDGSAFDFRHFSVANDEKFLFIRFGIAPFTKLLEDNQIALFIDGDNNAATGFQVNGIGAELRFNFGSRNGYNYYFNASFSHASISFRSLPTVTDTLFEIAIGRQNIPPSGGNGTVRLFFRESAGSGDLMPNAGQTFSYTFDNTPAEPYGAVQLAKSDTSLLRVMNWNTLNDGLTESGRDQYYRRILSAIRPEVMAFNELWNTTAAQAAARMNDILPVQGGSWYAAKLDAGNIIVSKYPIIQSWLVYPGQRITASLIDLPQSFGSDILLIACHYKCCGGASNDETRQREADATIAFVLDAKNPGGLITLPQNTPIVILGDMNFVGDRKQLKTLLTGEIVNTQLFGNGAKPDWDNSDFEDMLAYQSDKRTAYTWRDDPGSFPPGRLDFQIFSNSSVTVAKSFVLQTEIMSQQRLAQYGLQQTDTREASDHFPKVSDILITPSVGVSNSAEILEFSLEQNYPNPFNPVTIIRFSLPDDGEAKLEMFDVLGRKIAEPVSEFLRAGTYTTEFNAEGLPGGVYIYRLTAGSYVNARKMTIVK